LSLSRSTKQKHFFFLLTVGSVYYPFSLLLWSRRVHRCPTVYCVHRRSDRTTIPEKSLHIVWKKIDKKREWFTCKNIIILLIVMLTQCVHIHADGPRIKSTMTTDYPTTFHCNHDSLYHLLNHTRCLVIIIFSITPLSVYHYNDDAYT